MADLHNCMSILLPMVNEQYTSAIDRYHNNYTIEFFVQKFGGWEPASAQFYGNPDGVCRFVLPVYTSLLYKVHQACFWL